MKLKNSYIVLEGISFAGKTTVLELLDKKLGEIYGKNSVVKTQEPWKETSTVENRLSGKKLLEYVVADRELHMEKLVLPSLANNQIVIGSRCCISTFVYQVIDDIEPCSFKECLALNWHFLVPGLTVFLYASEAEIEKRAKTRPDQSRFEKKAGFRQKEREQYFKVIAFLKTKGWNILEINTTNLSQKKVVNKILVAIREIK